jgi:hypothetical protein
MGLPIRIQYVTAQMGRHAPGLEHLQAPNGLIREVAYSIIHSSVPDKEKCACPNARKGHLVHRIHEQVRKNKCPQGTITEETIRA